MIACLDLENLETRTSLKENLQEKIKIHFLGGLGDACLVRKYPVILNELSNIFEVSSIVDIYRNDEFTNQNKITGLLNVIKTIRLKGTLNSEIESEIISSLSNGRIKYFCIDSVNPIIPSEFLKKIQKGDVIDISVPNKFHVKLAEQILDNTQAHIIIEKPLSASLEEILKFEDYLEMNDFSNRILCDAEHYSHYPNIREYLYYFYRYVNGTNKLNGYGKVKGIELYILENESFNNQRNKDIIDIEKSGGGMWLDTGIHAIAYLRNIGAEIDYDSINAQPYKNKTLYDIQDNRYGENLMDVNFCVHNNSFFSNCNVRILVGKDPNFQRKKLFVMHHEKGRIELNIAEKSFCVYDNRGVIIENKSFPGDAFYYVFTDLYNSISKNEEPFTSLNKAIQNIKDIFEVYKRSRPLERY